MRIPTYPIFGQSNYAIPQVTSWNGQQGWFTVPPGWILWQDENFQLWTSPNSDKSLPNYTVLYDNVGTAMFQDLMRSKLAGLDTP